MFNAFIGSCRQDSTTKIRKGYQGKVEIDCFHLNIIFHNFLCLFACLLYFFHDIYTSQLTFSIQVLKFRYHVSEHLGKEINVFCKSEIFTVVSEDVFIASSIAYYGLVYDIGQEKKKQHQG